MRRQVSVVAVTNILSDKVTTFTYDGDGRRVLRDTVTDTVAYIGPHYEARYTKTDKPEDLDDDCVVTVIDIMQVAAQWGAAGGPEDVDGSGTVDVGDVQQVAGQWRETCHVLAGTTKYYMLGGRRVAMRKAGTLYYLFGDHLGSTSVSYNTANGQTQAQRYYPWGTIRPGPANTLPTDRTFTGQPLDETIGLLYYSDGVGYGRYYDPALGRFSQPDILVPNPGDPQQLNRYSYAANNPLRYTDPTGHWLETLWDIANIVWDIHEVRRDPSLLNIGALVVDVGAAVIPFVPGGVGAIVHGSKAAKIATEAATHGDETVDAVRAVGRLTDAANLAKSTGASLSAARRLKEIGLHSPEAGDLVKALAKACTRDDPASKYVLLGSFPEYTDVAKLEGMTYLDIPGDVWNTLSAAGDEFVEAVNMQFLEDAIASGKHFVVVLGEGKAPGKWLKKELRYLIERGYHLENGVWVPGQ